MKSALQYFLCGHLPSGLLVLGTMMGASLVACSGSDGASTGTGVGGGTSAGGIAATGGVISTGGLSANGGTLSSGGAMTNGGTALGGATNASGGASASGGMMSVGGVSVTGGTTPLGGARATGGTIAMSGAATGGSKGTGGATSGGAATSTGGVATGGKSATGGDATGGAATGGAAIGGAATGGKSATGGAATAGAAAGGKSATGGASSTGGCGAIGTWNNPILPGLYADPSISVFNCKYYIYPTTDGFANWASTQFHAFSSSDLATWKDEGVILDLGPDVSWAASRAWAPKLVLKNGTYYFYFSADLQIGVATSTSPIGPFKDALGKPLITAGQYGGESIDPYVFTDDDGRSYLFFGSTSAGGHVVELNADMISLNGTPQLNAISGYKEASVVFKRNGKYYFMWSEGDTRLTTYNVAYGTASTPMGPYARAAVNPILQSDTAQGIWATGSNDVLQLSNGDFFIVYHRFAIPNGDGMHREVCLDRLNFNADGTIIPVKPTP